MPLLAIFQTARAEEEQTPERFGRPYADYMKQSARFIPFLLWGHCSAPDR